MQVDIHKGHHTRGAAEGWPLTTCSLTHGCWRDSLWSETGHDLILGDHFTITSSFSFPFSPSSVLDLARPSPSPLPSRNLPFPSSRPLLPSISGQSQLGHGSILRMRLKCLVSSDRQDQTLEATCAIRDIPPYAGCLTVSPTCCQHEDTSSLTDQSLVHKAMSNGISVDLARLDLKELTAQIQIAVTQCLACEALAAWKLRVTDSPQGFNAGHLELLVLPFKPHALALVHLGK